MATPGDYPEHDRMMAAKERTQAAGEFLDWLASKGIGLRWIGSDHTEPCRPCVKTTRDLLADWANIDLDVIEDEKMVMLAAMREANR